jgi:hypothetical protein
MDLGTHMVCARFYPPEPGVTRREFGRALIHGRGLRLGTQGIPAISKRRGDRLGTMRLGRIREQDPERGEGNATRLVGDAGGRTHRTSRARARAGRGAPRPWRASAESTAREGAAMGRKRSARAGKKLHGWARRLEITTVLSGEEIRGRDITTGGGEKNLHGAQGIGSAEDFSPFLFPFFTQTIQISIL